MITSLNALKYWLYFRNNELHMIDPENKSQTWINPSKRLVDKALDRWSMCK